MFHFDKFFILFGSIALAEKFTHCGCTQVYLQNVKENRTVLLDDYKSPQVPIKTETEGKIVENIALKASENKGEQKFEVDETFPIKSSCLKKDGGQYNTFGYYPHLQNCEMFVRCDQVSNFENGLMIVSYQSGLSELTCPDGLHFNTQLNVCDWPSKANCQVEDQE